MKYAGSKYPTRTSLLVRSSAVLTLTHCDLSQLRSLSLSFNCICNKCTSDSIKHGTPSIKNLVEALHLSCCKFYTLDFYTTFLLLKDQTLSLTFMSFTTSGTGATSWCLKAQRNNHHTVTHYSKTSVPSKNLVNTYFVLFKYCVQIQHVFQNHQTQKYPRCSNK